MDPWVGQFTSLSLGFLLCKVILAASTSQGGFEGRLNKMTMGVVVIMSLMVKKVDDIGDGGPGGEEVCLSTVVV